MSYSLGTIETRYGTRPWTNISDKLRRMEYQFACCSVSQSIIEFSNSSYAGESQFSRCAKMQNIIANYTSMYRNYIIIRFKHRYRLAIAQSLEALGNDKHPSPSFLHFCYFCMFCTFILHSFTGDLWVKSVTGAGINRNVSGPFLLSFVEIDEVHSLS